MIILKMQRPTLFVFQPGQYAFLRLDSIDRSWHPFSIASEPDSSIVEFYIEVFGEGSWSERLWTKLNSHNKRQSLNIELMGPYGTALIQGKSLTNVVAVGSGTGKSAGNINTLLVCSLAKHSILIIFLLLIQ